MSDDNENSDSSSFDMVPRHGSRARTPPKRPDSEGFEYPDSGSRGAAGEVKGDGGSGSAASPANLFADDGKTTAGAGDVDCSYTDPPAKKKKAAKAVSTRALAREREKEVLYLAIQNLVPEKAATREATELWCQVGDEVRRRQNLRVMRDGKVKTIEVNYDDGRPVIDRGDFADTVKRIFREMKAKHKKEDTDAPKKTWEGTLTDSRRVQRGRL